MITAMKRDDSMKTKKNQKGFTLIELITVIMIIGILATILVPAVMNYAKKARITAAIADTKVVRSAIESSLINHLTEKNASNAFNKVLYLDQNPDKNKRDYEVVGVFTNVSWVIYRTNEGGKQGASQEVDRVIASAIDNAFTENWETGLKKNPMAYHTNSDNCEKFIQDQKTNFGLVVVYNRTGSIRMMQLYRKGILVTYLKGDYIVNTNDTAHFVGEGVWSTIYSDSGEEAPQEYSQINLANGQLKNGKLNRWY